MMCWLHEGEIEGTLPLDRGSGAGWRGNASVEIGVGEMARHHRRSPAEAERKSGGTPVIEPEPVRIGMLGGFRVSVGSRTIEESHWRLRKAAALLKLLALALMPPRG